MREKPTGLVVQDTTSNNQRDLKLPFKYKQLLEANGIRLLRLQPGLLRDPIMGILDHAVLPSCECIQLETQQLTCVSCEKMPPIVPYEALSYAWGDAQNTNTIFLSDAQSALDRPLRIASNCAQALEQLRLPDKERLIWIDAICINQSDISERSAQVRIMHRIYRAALRVLVYLGERSTDSDEAICILEDDAKGGRPFITDNLSYGEIKAVKALLNRPWFHRVWVLQEVAWSKSALVLCGSRITPWRETFHRAYTSSISQIGDLKPLPYVMSFGKVRSPEPLLTPDALLGELRNARDCAPTDPVDKIYAVLELLRAAPGDSRLAIDYNRQPATVFTDVAEYLLEGVGLGLLSDAYGHSTMSGLPSWAPDWTIPSQKKAYYFVSCWAGGRRPGHIEFVSSPHESGPRMMRIRGVSVGRVDRICATFNDSLDGGLATLIQLIDSTESFKAVERLVKNISHVESVGLGNLSYLVSAAAMQAVSDPDAFARTRGKALKQILSRLQSRTLFLSGGKRPGLGPHTMQEKDEIFILESGKMCYILRRSKAAYKLVGECFLAAYMRDTFSYDSAGNCIQANGKPVPWKDVVIS